MAMRDATSVCIGFGDTEGKCTQIVMPRAPFYWCENCEQKRRDHIDASFERMAQEWEDRMAGQSARIAEAALDAALALEADDA